MVGRSDERYPLRLGPQGGFVCAAYNCPAMLALNGYDRNGKLVVHEEKANW